MVALFSNQKRYSESHAVIRTVRLLVTVPGAVAVVPPDDDGPTRRTSTSRKTVRTTDAPGLWPNAAVLIVASMVMRSPTWTYPPTPVCSPVGMVTAIQPSGIGR